MKCRHCKGLGYYQGFNFEENWPKYMTKAFKCHKCNGTGKIPDVADAGTKEDAGDGGVAGRPPDQPAEG